MLVRQVAFHARELQIGFIVLVGDPYAALVFDVAVGHWMMVDMPRVAGRKSEFFPAVIAVAVGTFEHSLLQRLGPFLSRHHSSVVGFLARRENFHTDRPNAPPTLAPWHHRSKKKYNK